LTWDVCIEIPKIPDPIELTLPGGLSLKHVNLEQLVQPALAPLGPAFKLLDAVMALVDVLTVLKDALTSVPPDFAKAANALSRVADIPTTLASLAPPLAIPVILSACLDLLLRSLGQVRSEIANLQQQMTNLVTTEQLAHDLDDARLLRVFECARHNVEQEVANVGQSMASIGHLLALVGTFGKLAGLDLQVPDLDSIAGRPLNEVLTPLDALVEVLRKVRSMPGLP
jgi:hypothetical protein